MHLKSGFQKIKIVGLLIAPDFAVNLKGKDKDYGDYAIDYLVFDNFRPLDDGVYIDLHGLQKIARSVGVSGRREDVVSLNVTKR